MIKQIVVKASKDARNRKRIKAAVSTQEMLSAFEEKLAEAGIESSTEVECTTGDPEMDDIMTKERQVKIYDRDWSVKYEDVGGGFDSDQSIMSLGEIKEYWNENNMGDPVLEEYPDFESWFKDTRSNFLKESY